MKNKLFFGMLLAIVMILSAVGVFAADPASPPGCNADNSVVNIARSTASAQPGQTITFTVSAGNPSSEDGCDVVDRMLTLTLPDGSKHYFGPSSFPNPTIVGIVGSVDYIANTDDLIGNIWTATVSWTGTQKDGFDSASNGNKGTSVVYVPVNLQVTKTAIPSVHEEYEWTLDKSVTPASWNLFDGDTAESEYTVSVTKTLSKTGYSLSGEITIYNPSLYATAQITGISDVISEIGAVSVSCPIDFDYTLGPQESVTCTYDVTYPSVFSGTNTATVTTTGDIGGNSDSVSFTFDGVTPTVSGGSIDVIDSNGETWTFSDTGSEIYTKTFDCSGLEYTDGYASYIYENTAEIEGTQISDSASVEVDCYKLSAKKDASTTYTRTYSWDIDKTVDVPVWNLFNGDSGTSEYTVSVTKDQGTDSAWEVNGKITLTNPNPDREAVIVDVVDVISTELQAIVNCHDQSIVPAAGSLVCDYSRTLPDGTERTNTATATMQNHAFDKVNFATAQGTTEVSAQASVTFGEPTTVVNDAINVDDTNGQSWSTSISDSWSYKRTFVCGGDEGEYDNTATIRETKQSDSATVEVICNEISVTKTAFATFDREYFWSINKVVDEDTWNMFAGQSGTSNYDVTVSNTGSEDSNYQISGVITITNPSTLEATLSSVTDSLGPVSCPSLFVPAGGSLVCTYTASVPTGKETENTVTVVMNGLSYADTVPVNYILDKEFNDCVSVTDSVEGSLGTVCVEDESTTFEYSTEFFCSEDEGSHPNTATIVETKQYDSVSVDVKCYDLEVSKTAVPSYTLTHEWNIEKSVTPASINLFRGETGDFEFTVEAIKSSTESLYAVSGVITINNPSVNGILINSISDVVTGGITAAVDCGVDLSGYELLGGDTLLCTYSAELPDKTSRTNTVTVNVGNDVEYNAYADIDFSKAVVTVVGEDTVTIDDDMSSAFPIILSGSGEFTYGYEYTCSNDERDYSEGQYSFSADNVATLSTGQSDSVSIFVDCYDLSVEKTASTTFTRTHEWEIDKDVDVDRWDLFQDDSGVSEYTVSVDKTGFIDSDFGITGTIVVYNIAPMDALLTDVVDSMGVVNCPSMVVPAEGSLTCTYTGTPKGNEQLNTATVSFGGNTYTATTPVSFTTPTTELLNEINVVDTNGESWGPVSADTTWTYEREFTCDDEGANPNTATIVETGADDDALVTVSCYDISVRKTASTTFTRTHEWEIDKDVDVEEFNLFDSASGTSTYTVSVDYLGFKDSDFAVSGEIVITNNAPIDAILTEVKDDLAEVVCPSNTVPSQGTLTCTYEGPADGDEILNTVTVSFGTRTYTATAPVSFTNPTTELYKEISVDDTNGMSWGPVSDDASWSYTRTFTCERDDAGKNDEGKHDNTATIVETKQSDDASVLVNCYDLEVSKTAETSYTRTYEWEIEKSVDPSSLVMFRGQEGSVEYDVTVTPSTKDSDFMVEGDITISNPATLDVEIFGVSDVISDDILATVDCGVTFPYTLPAGDELICSYGASLPDKANRVNTVTVDLGQGMLYTATADVIFGEPTIVNNEDITVDDSNVEGESWSASGASASWTYSKTFKCSADAIDYTDGHYSYTVDNTATITETGASDSESVTVDCYDATIGKDAVTSYDRQYSWTIDKQGTNEYLMLEVGEEHMEAYTVTVTPSYEDSNFAVMGVITITNPTPVAVEVTSVTDEISGGITADVDCSEADMTLAAGESTTCSYSADLPDKESRVNTVTIVMNGITYTATADIEFGEPTNVYDECITVVDDQYGDLGEVCEVEEVFNYELELTQDVCLEEGTEMFTNVASFTSNDTPLTGSDSWTVTLEVPCETGCTYTQGYWKTHDNPETKQFDEGWYNVGALGAGEMFYLSGQTWAEVFDTPASNPYYQLAHQYMAAWLNWKNEASVPTDVESALVRADEIFDVSKPSDFVKVKGKMTASKALVAEMTALAGTLGSYNEGLVGPGHCDDSMVVEEPVFE